MIDTMPPADLSTWNTAVLAKIIVTGATGFVGRHCVERWRKRQGVSVLPIVRTATQCDQFQTQCLLLRQLTATRLRDLGWGEASLVHLIGASRDHADHSMWESIVGTTDMVTRVARDAGAKRIVYLSGYGVCAGSTEPYFRAKCRAEAIIRTAEIPHTIFRPSYILGRGDELVPQLVAGFRRGQVEVPGSGLYRMQPLLVADVVSVLLAAATDASGRSHTTPLLGEPTTYLDLVKALAGKLAPEARIVTVEFEGFVRQMVTSPEPELTMSELAVLICDYVGPPTLKCFGETLSDFGSVIERVAGLYSPN